MKRNFTLLELLTVVAIIGVLTGILLPAVSKIREKAKITQSMVAIKSLQIALSQYFTTYSILPFTGSTGGNNDALLSSAEYTKLLCTLNATTDVPCDAFSNPRKIRFLEMANGEYKDAWDNNFQVAFDLDYDNVVDTDYIYGDDTQNNTIVIWSLGPDKAHHSNDTDPTNDDNVTSWTSD